MTVHKLKIAWFSDLSASTEKETLSSYFSRELLPLLRNRFEITLFHNSFKNFEDYNTFHYLKAFELHKENPFDVFFYQLEDDPRLNFIRSHIGLLPGVTYFHHFNFTGYGPEPTLNSPYTEIVNSFNHSIPHAPLTDWPDRKKKFKPKGPAAFREAAFSPIAVFSSAHSLNEYKRQVELKLNIRDESGLNVFYLPYPVDTEVQSSGSRASDNLLTISFAGSAQIEQRAHKLLSALSDTAINYKFNWMLPKSELSQAEELLSEYQVKNCNLCTNYNAESWGKIAAQSDCAVHTLFSAYGHIQPYFGISLSYGLPVTVINFASSEELPDSLVFKVQPGENEATQIKEIIESLSENKVLLNTIEIQKYCMENYNKNQIAAELSSIFIKKSGYILEIMKRWQALEKEAGLSLLKESDSFIHSDAAGLKSFIRPAMQELGWVAND